MALNELLEAHLVYNCTDDAAISSKRCLEAHLYSVQAQDMAISIGYREPYGEAASSCHTLSCAGTLKSFVSSLEVAQNSIREVLPLLLCELYGMLRLQLFTMFQILILHLDHMYDFQVNVPCR